MTETRRRFSAFRKFSLLVLAAGVVSAIFLGIALWPKEVPEAGWRYSYIQKFYRGANSHMIRERFYPVIAIDIDGSGVALSKVHRPRVSFDLSINGFDERTGWIRNGTALLVRDADGNGRIDDGAELVGTADGNRNAFEVMSALDTDGDGWLTPADPAFSDLKLWRDEKPLGRSAPNELVSLASLGISAIGLTTKTSSAIREGHLIRQTAEVKWRYGTTTEVAEVLFRTDQRIATMRLPEGLTITEEAKRLPTVFGYGQIPSTYVLYSADTPARDAALELIVLLDKGEVIVFERAFIGFFYRWAGVETIDPRVCGPYVDARDLAVLYKVYGWYLDRLFEASTTCPWPYPNDADGIRPQYTKFRDKMRARFMAQVPDIGSDHPLAPIAPLALGMRTSLRKLQGRMSDVAAGLAGQVSAGRLSAGNAAAAARLVSRDLAIDSRQMLALSFTGVKRDGLNFSDALFLAALAKQAVFN